MASTQAPPPHRPPSPTELSYTNLVKLAPPTARKSERSVANGGGAVDAVDASVSVMMPPSASLTPMPSAAVNEMTSAITTGQVGSRIAHGSSRLVNSTPAVPTAVSFQNQYQTPHYRTSNTTNTMPMSAPNPALTSTHASSTQFPYPKLPHTVNIGKHKHQSHHFSNDNFSEERVEERVANLALRLQSMEIPHTNNINAATLNNSQLMQSSQRIQEINQFIETMRGMQSVISRTSDEQQRVKKSRALNALLNMFESIMEERMSREDGDNGEYLENRVQHLEQRVKQVESENEQLQYLCGGKDDQLKLVQQQMQNLQHEMQQLAAENNQLKEELAHSQDQCHQERLRAQDAEQVAIESENVRDGLLSNYGRLTEENVELERAMEIVNSEKQTLERELGYQKDEVMQLKEQCEAFTHQLQQKDLNMAEMETKFESIISQLSTHRQSLQYVTTNRQRLQDELHASQRNANSATEQLIALRNKYTQLQRETDSKRRNQLTNESDKGNLQIQLQEEQQKRRELDGVVSQSKAKEVAANEQIRKLARVNAELKTRVNELTARLENPLELSATMSNGIVGGVAINACVDYDSASMVIHNTPLPSASSNATEKVVYDEAKEIEDKPSLLDYLP